MLVGIANNLAEDTNHDWPKLQWVENAFRNIGCDVRRSRNHEQFGRNLKECDFVVCGMKSICGRWVNIEQLMRERTCPTVYWWFDLIATHPTQPLEQQPYFRNFQQPLQEMDIVLVKEHSLLAEYKRLGVNAYWFDQGIPRDYPEMGSIDLIKWDMLVWGQSVPLDSTTDAWKQRVRAARDAVKAGLRVAWAGRTHGGVPEGVERLPFHHPNDLPKLASNALSVLSVGWRNDLTGYWSDSFWMAVGMGAYVLRKQTPGMPSGPFKTFRDNDELIRLIQQAKENPQMVKKIREEARIWATGEQSLESKCEKLIQLVRTARERGLLKTAMVRK